METDRFSFFGVRADPSSVSNSKRNKISMNMISKYDDVCRILLQIQLKKRDPRIAVFRLDSLFRLFSSGKIIPSKCHKLFSDDRTA